MLLPALQVELVSQLAAAQAEVASVQQSWSQGLSQEQLTLEQLQQQEAQLTAGSGSLSSSLYNALSPRRVAALLTRSRNASVGSNVASNPRQPLPDSESPLRGAAAEGTDCTGSAGVPSMLSPGSGEGTATEDCTNLSCCNSDSNFSRAGFEAPSDVRGHRKASAASQDGPKQREEPGPHQPAK